jgi:hypothetical protein
LKQAYFIAWLLDLITPLFIITLITLIVYPPSRGFLFPPAPIALVDSKTGGVQKPKAGVLGSYESATGAPENHKGEAVEQYVFLSLPVPLPQVSRSLLFRILLNILLFTTTTDP